MKKFTIFIVFVILCFMSSDLFSAWTITTNRSGKYSAELTVICSHSNQATRSTNYELPKNLRQAKVPLQYFITIMSQQLGYMGNLSMNVEDASNLRFSFSSVSGLRSSYIKAKVILMLPNPVVK